MAFTRQHLSDGRAEVAEIVARRVQPGGFQPTAALASAAADEEQMAAAPQAPQEPQTAGFNRGGKEKKEAPHQNGFQSTGVASAEELVKARAHQNGLHPATPLEREQAVFKRRGFQADGKEEKIGFRLKRNGEEKPAENSTLSAAQVAAAVAAEANHARLLEDERDARAKPSFQAQLRPKTTSERRVAAKGTGRENKKPRLMAVSDGEGSE